MILLAIALQVAQPAPPPAPPPAETLLPDIQLDATLTARRVVVENEGEVDLTLRASPDGGTELRVDAPDLPEGRRVAENVRIEIRSEARIADPLRHALEAPSAQEPPSPQ